MSLTQIDFLVRTNEDWLDTFELTNEDESAADLTGTTFRAQIRRTPDELHVVLEADTENGNLLIASPATGGVVGWNLGAETMKTFEPGAYVYDLVWINAGGVVDTIAFGAITVERGVTRE